MIIGFRSEKTTTHMSIECRRFRQSVKTKFVGLTFVENRSRKVSRKNPFGFTIFCLRADFCYANRIEIVFHNRI